MANILDVDHAMMLVALTEEKGCTMFFDFKAAFPNLSHRFLHRVLGSLGLPGWVLRFCDVLCQNNQC